jgi:ParB/RepB/Spo0J family partition protein
MTLTLEQIKVGDIVIDEELDFRTTGQDITELAASIKDHGLMQPITVTPANGDGKHHVIAGRRRLRAVLELGQKTIDAIVREDMAAEDAQVVGQIIENLHREDISPMDEARSFAKLLDFDFAQKDIAAMVNCSPGHVSGRLALLKLPESVVDKVAKGQIPSNVAVKLARAPKDVREDVAAGTVIDERAIASAQRAYDERRGREKTVEALVEKGVPAATGKDGWGYLADDKKADLIGLTDDDKPKTHQWDEVGTVPRQRFESDDEFVDAVVAEKPKGVWIAGAGDFMRAHIIGSANLDLQRKKEQERLDAERTEREAAERKRREQQERAIQAVVDAPDKAKLIAAVLQDLLESRLGTRNYNRLSTVSKAIERLGITEEIEPGADEHETTDRLVELVKRHASKSTMDMCRALVATTSSIDGVLVGQGVFDHLDVKLADLDDQTEWYDNGWVTKDQLSGAAREVVEAWEKEEAEEQAFERRVDAAVEIAVAAKLAEDGVEELSDTELQAISSQVRTQLYAEDQAG